MSMTLISTVTAAGQLFDATFSNIPQDGTDLLLVISARTGDSATSFNSRIRFNDNESGFAYSWKRLTGNGSAASSTESNASNDFQVWSVNGNTATANTFGSTSVYIANYTSATVKNLSVETLTENNATAARQELVVGAWNGSAITKLDVKSVSQPFEANSTFSLYKITKGSGGASVS